jgi:hypothetical protein
MFTLLKPEENVGVLLTSGFLLEPDQSTSAIIVHHPTAKFLWSKINIQITEDSCPQCPNEHA